MAMKFVFGIVALGLIAYLVGFFLPQSYEITREVVIDAPRAEIHAQLQDVTTWRKWSAFVPGGEAADSVESRYEGPDAGAGAIWYWGKDLESKPARLEVLTSDPNWGISYLLQLDGGRVESGGDSLFQDHEAGPKVIFVHGGEMASPWRRYFSLIADKAVGPALQQSLDGLKVRVEGGVPAEPAPEGQGETDGDEAGTLPAEPVGAGQ
ncbi:MAG: SRPBCC family protein [Planctomycetota bacterium]|nr:SRPBCC family protein [Planctomycetota bacterium]